MRGLAMMVSGLVTAALVGLGLSAVGEPDARTGSYDTYVACTTRVHAPASHSCPKEHKKGAFFTSLHAHVFYKVCVKFPNGKRLCAKHQEAAQGEKRVNPITSDQVGKHVVTWFVGGHQIGRFAFRIHR